MKLLITLIVLILFLFPAFGQQIYKYRVTLTDKQPTVYSLERPEEFLSQKSLERRAKQNLSPDSTDLPVCKVYIDGIKEKGVEIIVTGKWNNTVTVQCVDTTIIDNIAKLAYVKEVEKVWFSSTPKAERNTEKRKQKITNKLKKTDNYYGAAYHQIAVHNGDSLHSAGFKGEGMTVAIIDAGYYNVDRIKAFKNSKILGTRDFVSPDSDIFAEDSHGLKVFSCMAGNKPKVMVGSAPEASYWLLRSEDSSSEHLVEQDYWAAAVEYADSLGVDVINTSLGYKSFDDKSKNYQYRDLDGHHALISRSAEMVADKGMVLLCSAGNEGRKVWKKITPPADAGNILTVGALDSLLVNANFSSVGNTADGRIKPDVSAIGERTVVIDEKGEVSRVNGTSFATPTLCGLVVCLWQACPELSAKEIIDLVRQSGDRVEYPDNVFGYGVPDLWKAYKKVKSNK